MMSEMEQTPKRVDNAWYRSVQMTATVSGAFFVIFAAMLVANLIGSAVLGPRRENRLAEMKVQIQKDPTNQEKLTEIRQLDFKIRGDRLWRLDFARNATFMLLGSVLVLVVAGRIAAQMEKEPPRPQRIAERASLQVREASQARWAVAGGLIVLIGAGLVLRLSGWVDFARAEDTGPPFASQEEKREQWHRFRGWEGAGVSTHANVPAQWNGKTGEGIVWKSHVPLPGRNSPVLWKDRVFLSGADANARQVYCFDANDGRLLWTGDVPTVPLPKGEELNIMEDTGYAASTLATDGRRVYVIFATGDLAAFDFHGRRLWHRNLGLPDSSYGYASSLETYEQLVLVQYDQGDGSEDKSRVIAIDGTTGKVAWEAKRTLPNSWTSPIVAEIGGQPQLITLADPCLVSYDPATGAELWRAECAGGDVAPSPIYAGGLILAVEPYAQLVAVRPDGKGDVTKTHIVWHMEEGAPDICSPVANEQYVYLLDTGGYLTCCKVEDGERLYETDLKDEFMASPSIVGDRLYLLGRKGTMRIAEIGPEYKEITRCELGEECFASPAFADGRIYIRGAENLYCIGQAPSRVAGILPAIRGRDALDTKEQGQDALATSPGTNELVRAVRR